MGFTEASVASSLVNTYTDYTQAFIDYAKEARILVAPSVSELSTQAYTDVAGVSHSNRSSAATVSAVNNSDFLASATNGLSVLPMLLLVFVKVSVVSDPYPEI